MKRTTLVMDEQILRDLKRIAAEEGRTLSEVTVEVLRLGLGRRGPVQPVRRRRLPVFSMGKARVDVANREHLFDVMDEP